MPGWMKWTISLLIGFGIIAIGFRYAGWLLSLFFVFNCFVLIVVVLLQSGKAADLAGAFGGAGSQTAFGPRGAATILSQATTWCAVMFMVCSLAMVLRVDKAVESGGSSVLQNVSRPAPKQAPAVPPATTPVSPILPQPNTQTPSQQPPTTQPPATQQPASQSPAQQPATQPQNSQAPAKPPASQSPASQPPTQPTKP